MSFLSGFMGNKGANAFVDQAVDKAAAVAKKKVRETISGKKQETDKTGGMGDVFPSKDEKDQKPKEKAGGGIFGGLLSTGKPEENSTGGGGAISAGGGAISAGGGAISAGGSKAESNTATDSNFDDALDDLALGFGEK